jgi:hypothetical protein
MSGDVFLCSVGECWHPVASTDDDRELAPRDGAKHLTLGCDERGSGRRQKRGVATVAQLVRNWHPKMCFWF